MSDLIVINNLTKKFKNNIILNNVNLKIESNKITTIYGRSGSGKSTLLNIIGLLEKKSEGDIFLFGKKAPKVGSKSAQKYLRYHISYLFQNYALLKDKSIDQNLDLVNFNKTSKKFIQRKKSIIQELQIKQPLNAQVGTLSGGEQQRVAMARMLLKPGEVILCDEPTGSLDPDNRDKVFKVLEYAKSKGKTILIVSRDPYIIKHSDVSYNIMDLMSGK